MAENILVCIPTFRRPKGLARLLAALEKLDTDARVSVLVADNDAERHEGFDLCQRLRLKYLWPLEAIIVPDRGIAQVRNAMLAHALDRTNAQFIAMLDDDEWPEPQWLTRVAARPTGNRRRCTGRFDTFRDVQFRQKLGRQF